MKVLVNGIEITVFESAKVKDALLKFDEKVLSKISGYEILDAYGNITETDGQLTEGSRLFVRELKNEK